MGMTYDEFWHGEPWLVKAYRKSNDMKRHERNYELWLQGKYIYDALRCTPLLVGFPEKGYKVPSDAGYPDRPYPLTEQEAREQEAEKERENFFAYLRNMEAQSERNKKAMKEAVKDGREHD